jgi:hypothetical protein
MTDTDALWRDPEPRTFEGKRLFGRMKLGLWTIDDAASVRDLGQRICQIENEARAEALHSAVEAITSISFGAGPVPDDSDRDRLRVATPDTPESGR